MLWQPHVAGVVHVCLADLVHGAGGGFSNLESCRVPWYQKSVVANYTSTSVMPPAGSWNTTGRGYVCVRVWLCGCVCGCVCVGRGALWPLVTLPVHQLP